MSASAADAEAEEERAVFDDDDDDTDDSEFDDDDDDDTDPDDLRRPNPAPSPIPATITAADAAAPPLIPNPSHPVSPSSGPTIQPSPLPPSATEPKIEERCRPLVPFDDSRRLFQRLWTDDDEIKILRGFLEFTTSRGTAFASHQYDTGPFYERIKRELQLDFTKNQLIEKLRRLKKKFRNAAARIAGGKDAVFKSPHDQATYDISRKIWSAGLKRGGGPDSEDDLGSTPIPPCPSVSDPNTDGGGRTRRRRIRRRIEETSVEVPVAVEGPAKTILALPPPPSAPVPNTIIEETVKSCLGPLFKELMYSVVGAPAGMGLNFGGLAINSLLNPLLPTPCAGAVEDEKWRKQRILELEVFAKRIELLQEQIKSTLEDLKSPLAAAES